MSAGVLTEEEVEGIRTGPISDPTVSQVAALAAVFGVEPSYLVDRKEPPNRRADALFELTDALLTAEQVPSPVHLSLQPSHRRGWGSLYDALSRGRIDAQTLRRLLAQHPLAGSKTATSVYAVDVSVWPRCDAECSPE